MKHFLILLALCLASYFAWRYAAKRDRRAVARFAGKHLLFTALIVFTLLAALGAAVRINSINIV